MLTYLLIAAIPAFLWIGFLVGFARAMMKD